MNDTRITNAFNSLAGEATPRPPAWHRVERGITRRHRVRLFSGIAASVVAILGMVSVVPRIGDAIRSDGFASPGASGAPIVGTRAAFRDDFAGYYFSFPAELRFHGFQDGVPGVSLTTANEDLTIEVLSQPPVKNITDTTKGMPAEELEPIAGGRAQRFAEAGSRRELYRITWNHGTQTLPKLIVVQFTVTTTSDDARASHADLVQEIVRGTSRVSDFRPARWLDAVVYTPWGRVDPGVRFDDVTAVVADFLSARADDETVTDSRSGTTSRIDRHGIAPSIFYESESLQAVRGYAIVGSTTMPNGDTKFSVRIDGGRDEVITVSSAQGDDPKIIDVRVV